MKYKYKNISSRMRTVYVRDDIIRRGVFSALFPETKYSESEIKNIIGKKNLSEYRKKYGYKRVERAIDEIIFQFNNLKSKSTKNNQNQIRKYVRDSYKQESTDRSFFDKKDSVSMGDLFFAGKGTSSILFDAKRRQGEYSRVAYIDRNGIEYYANNEDEFYIIDLAISEDLKEWQKVDRGTSFPDFKRWIDLDKDTLFLKMVF